MQRKWTSGYRNWHLSSDELFEAGWTWSDEDEAMTPDGLVVHIADLAVLDDVPLVSPRGMALWSGEQLVRVMERDMDWRPDTGDPPPRLMKEILSGVRQYTVPTLATIRAGIGRYGEYVRGFVALRDSTCIEWERPLPTSTEDWLWQLPDGWTDCYCPLTSLVEQPVPLLHSVDALLKLGCKATLLTEEALDAK